MLLPRALRMRAGIKFQAGHIAHMGIMLQMLSRLIPAEVSPSMKTMLQQRFSHIPTLADAVLQHAGSAVQAPLALSNCAHFYSLHVQQAVATQLPALQHFPQFHGFPDVVRLQEIGSISAGYGFHSVYAAHFTILAC